MKLIICLDTKNGMLFNRRRQSKDSVLCKRILENTLADGLWMNEYSAKMFGDAKINVDSEFLSKACENEYCFVEGDGFLPFMDKIKQITVYRWDKVYPADVKLDSAVLGDRRLIRVTEFVGSSHAKITEEIYE